VSHAIVFPRECLIAVGLGAFDRPCHIARAAVLVSLVLAQVPL
jgi:hypothetical protein